MPKKRIVCESCGSIRISKDPEYGCINIQEISKKTEKPIGTVTTYLWFKCLDCGDIVSIKKPRLRPKPN